ncbi:hypothetical protein SprV_0702445500 [Sparganum proliferum]
MVSPKCIGSNVGEPQQGVIDMPHFQLVLTCSFLPHFSMAGRVPYLCRVGIGEKSRVRIRSHVLSSTRSGHDKLPTQISNRMADEYANLKQMLQQQLKLMEALTVKLSNRPMGQLPVADGSHPVDHSADNITDFLYDLVAHITWYKRYED